MYSIHVQLFNTPMIFKDGQKVFLPFRKAEALFYYLMVHQQVTRDGLVGLFWDEVPDNIAKKNLRNAMYQIRKAFDLDIIISPQRSVVMLNPHITINSDLEAFIKEEDIEAYKGEFLQGFSLKEGEGFEDWLRERRQYYKDIYIAKLHESLVHYMNIGDETNIEKHAKILINADSFDDRGYKILMELYGKQGAYHKGIEIYYRLEKILLKELGIGPDEEVKERFKELLASRHKGKVRQQITLKPLFYGRDKELRGIHDEFNRFMEGDAYSSVLITGEAGIGKTTLKEWFIEEINHESLYILHSNCYQAEEKYLLKPWNPILSKLSKIIDEYKIQIPSSWKNIIASIFPLFQQKKEIFIPPVEEFNTFQYRIAEEALIGVMREVSNVKKTLLIFEDIQWMDNLSLALLSSILLQPETDNIFFIGTCREGYDNRLSEFTTKMKKYNLLHEINIKRFNRRETEEFAKKALPSFRMKKKLIENIYRETEGNTFFIIEYINALKQGKSLNEITPKMKDVLKSRFLEISDEEKKLLNIISLFFDKAPLDILKQLTDKDELEIIEIAGQLQQKNMINFIDEGNKISLQFTHQKLREFVYQQQSLGMRKVLHNRIGNLLETQLRNDKGDALVYSKLIYHFYNGGNQIAALKYSIKNINIYLDFRHELFPVINYRRQEQFYSVERELDKHLKDIEEKLKQTKKYQSDNKNFITLEINFLHIKGRYLIKEGNYEEGLPLILEMLEKAHLIDDEEYLLKGYRQMIYYAIQVYRTDLMIEYVKRGLTYGKSKGCKKEIAIFLRLKGLYQMMIGEYDKAEKTLGESISILEEMDKFEDKYILNIAGAYNYLGEIKRHNGDFTKALAYYDRATGICEEQNATKGLALFNTNAGIAAFEMKEEERARAYFKKALQYYDKMDTIWGRSIAEAYMALLFIKIKNYKEGSQSLERAERYSSKLKSPYEMGILYRVKAEIKADMENNEELKNTFNEKLPMELEYYCAKGINLLKEVNHFYEADMIKSLLLHNGRDNDNNFI